MNKRPPVNTSDQSSFFVCPIKVPENVFVMWSAQLIIDQSLNAIPEYYSSPSWSVLNTRTGPFALSRL